jgi:AAA domain/Bifunctional DNA primase/polymerase, N-terminal/Primase C terminal 2 (PriCT-2)
MAMLDWINSRGKTPVERRIERLGKLSKMKALEAPDECFEFCKKQKAEGERWERSLAIAGCTGSDNVVRLRPRNTTPALEAAMGYAIFRGWKVFPARMEDGGKWSWLSAEFAPGGENWGMTRDLEILPRNFTNPKWRLLCGVGVPTGYVNRIFVVEADTIEGHDVDGVGNLAALEKKHGKLPDTLMGQSPSGSPHRYFRHHGRGFKVKLGKLIDGVDVKGDGGMVVAPPSIAPSSMRCPGQYVWLNNLPIAEAPQWLLDLVCEKSSGSDERSSSGKDAFEQFGKEQRHEAPIERVRDTLAAIPNDDVGWEDWNRVGMATYSATGGNADGLAAFDAWSRKSSKYNKRKTFEKWLAYFGSPPNNIGYGSLKHLADEATPGWDTPSATPENKGDALKAKLMQTSAEFVSGYRPPDYLVDGLLQRRYVYSFTAPTGSGKTAIALLIAAHVAMGRALASREVEKGRVLFFAGENPDDVRSRWIKLCEELEEDPDTMDVVFMPFTPILSEQKIRARIDAEAAEHGPFSLLIVDTSASYYTGNDENDNVELGKHAKMLRTFVDLPGGPTVLVTCHPTKNPNMDNLLPRGGGAFLAEVDGNLVGITDRMTMTVEMTTHGKFRGPEFAPFSFKLVPSKSPILVDTKGREIWTVFARPISDEDVEQLKTGGRRDQDMLLRSMLDKPNCSLLEFAEHLVWLTSQGKPNKQKVHRLMKDLVKAKLVMQGRDERYVLTPKGDEEAKKTPENMVKVEKKEDNEKGREQSGKGVRFGADG